MTIVRDKLMALHLASAIQVRDAKMDRFPSGANSTAMLTAMGIAIPHRISQMLVLRPVHGEG